MNGSMRTRLTKLERARRAHAQHVLFASSPADADRQQFHLVQSGHAQERDEFIRFITNYEERL